VDTKITYYRVWRSFKLRPFSIAISIFIVAHFKAPLKSLKYFFYILYIHENVYYNLIQEIPICGFGYMVISFQSYKISIYIDIPRRFLNSVNGDYKIQSHGK
jgi:hypothetical protein